MGLLRPHRAALSMGLLAITGESLADVLQPWPLKIVLDNVLPHKKVAHGWLTNLLDRTVGTDPMRILMVACVAVLVIAAARCREHLRREVGDDHGRAMGDA